MNYRAVKEWVGKTPDTPLPRSAYLRIYREQGGTCPQCGRKLRAGQITIEHVKPISMGGENRESNIQLWCTVPCSRQKTAEEAPQRAKADRVAAQALGFKPRQRRPMPGSRASGWKKKFDGTAVRRDTDEM